MNTPHKSALVRESAAIEHACRVLRAGAQHPEIIALRHETAQRCLASRARNRAPLRRAAVAATVLVMAGVVALVTTGAMGGRTLLTDMLWQSKSDAVYGTAVGERRSLTLADGSRVTLDTQSELQLAFTPSERNVRLTRGQALFQVARDRVRPFVVTAGNRRFVALGTAFDVSVSPQQIKITMVEGVVRVESAADLVPQTAVPPSAAERASRAPLTIRAGDQLIVDRQQMDHLYDVDPKQVTSWLRGQIVFDNTSLAVAVAELNRYSATRIELADPELADVRLSGTFTADRPELFVEAITTYYPIAVAHQDAKTVVLKSR